MTHPPASRARAPHSGSMLDVLRNLAARLHLRAVAAPVGAPAAARAGRRAKRPQPAEMFSPLEEFH
jgi:hypothetical protein